MKMKETTHYAVRVVVYLSLHKDSVATIHQISEATHISAKYLAKIMHMLKSNQLVTAVRGCEGGYKINPNKSKISLYDILQSIEKDLDEEIKISKYFYPESKNKIEEINQVYASLQSDMIERLKQFDLLA